MAVRRSGGVPGLADPASAATVVGGAPLQATPADLIVAFPVRIMRRVRGVGFTAADGREWCFWTRQTGEVLEALSASNFPVSGTPQSPSKVWKAVP